MTDVELTEGVEVTHVEVAIPESQLANYTGIEIPSFMGPLDSDQVREVIRPVFVLLAIARVRYDEALGWGDQGGAAFDELRRVERLIDGVALALDGVAPISVTNRDVWPHRYEQRLDWADGPEVAKKWGSERVGWGDWIKITASDTARIVASPE